MSRLYRLLLLPVVCGLAACSSSREFTKEDTWIADCDTLTQEIARLTDDMTKDEVERILGFQSWILRGDFDSHDVYRQTVIYNYNANCEKLRGKSPSTARRRLIIEYSNNKVSRVIDSNVNQSAK